MPAVAATNPPVLIAMVAGATHRIRVGSGGVMLPNHAPLVVAEQFALLEAAYPGRIDLGIGRAPGTDPVTSWALRHGAGGVSDEAVEQFPQYVDDVAGDDGHRRGRGRGRWAPPPAAGDPACDRSGRRVAARLLRLLGPARGREGPALRVRPPLLRLGDRRGAGALPLAVPALAGAGGAAHLPHPQRRGGRDAGSRPTGWPCPSCCRCWRCAPASRCTRSSWSRRPRRPSCPRRTASCSTRCGGAG